MNPLSILFWIAIWSVVMLLIWYVIECRNLKQIKEARLLKESNSKVKWSVLKLAASNSDRLDILIQLDTHTPPLYACFVGLPTAYIDYLWLDKKSYESILYNKIKCEDVDAHIYDKLENIIEDIISTKLKEREYAGYLETLDDFIRNDNSTGDNTINT